MRKRQELQMAKRARTDKVYLREDVAPGLLRIQEAPIANEGELFGPLVVLPFHMADVTSLDNTMQEALWVGLILQMQ